MSRWTNFNVEEIQQRIEGIQRELKKLHQIDLKIIDTMPEFYEEIGRAKKVLDFVIAYLKNLDPYLTKDSGFASSINSNLVSITNSINAFFQSPNISYIHGINTAINYILENLSSHTFPTLQKPKTPTSFTNLVKIYEDEISKSIKKLELTQTLQDINSIRDAYHSICTNENSLINQIQNIKLDADSKLQKIDDLAKQIENKHDLICIDDETGVSLSTEISKTKNKAEDELEEIQNLKQESQENNNAIQSTIQELQSFYHKVFGKEDENGKKIEGIEDKIEKREKETETKFSELKKDFEDFVKEEKAKLNAHYQQAKEAYEMTISGGLSKTFFEQAQEQKENTKEWDQIFKRSLWLIVFATVGMAWYLGAERLLDISAFFVRIVFILPFVWLAIYASQRRAESQRLAQEYTHKATTLQTYLLHKDEIHNLQQKDDELMNKLINSNIDTVAFNPSSSLDKVNKDKDYKNLIKDTKEIIKDTKEIIQEFQAPNTQKPKSGNQQ